MPVPFSISPVEKTREKGLQSLFYQNVNFQETMYKLYALAYVPPKHVVRFYYDLVLDYIECKIDEDEDWRAMSQELDEYGLYYTNTWIGKIAETRAGSGKGTGHKPLHSIKSWNQYDSILSGGVSTTVWRVCIAHGWEQSQHLESESYFKNRSQSPAEFYYRILWDKI